MKPRTNLFWKIPHNTFCQLVAGSKSIGEVFDKLKVRRSGAYYRVFKRAIAERNIDTSHFTGHMPNLGKAAFNSRSLEDVFSVDSSVSSSTLRGKLKKHNLLPYKCSECKGGDQWNGKPLVLPVDHINGNRNDNRLENLRYLCPNCHSQTETFCGRSRTTRVHTCPDCQLPYKGYGQKCGKCAAKGRTFHLDQNGVGRVAWPTDEQLKQKVWEISLFPVAKELGCTEAAIRKHCKRNGIELPPMGYWVRRHNGYTHEEALVSQKKNRPKARRISAEQIEQAQRLITEGYSLRRAAKTIGFSHTSLRKQLPIN